MKVIKKSMTPKKRIVEDEIKYFVTLEVPSEWKSGVIVEIKPQKQLSDIF